MTKLGPAIGGHTPSFGLLHLPYQHPLSSAVALISSAASSTAFALINAVAVCVRRARQRGRRVVRGRVVVRRPFPREHFELVGEVARGKSLRSEKLLSLATIADSRQGGSHRSAFETPQRFLWRTRDGSLTARTTTSEASPTPNDDALSRSRSRSRSLSLSFGRRRAVTLFGRPSANFSSAVADVIGHASSEHFYLFNASGADATTFVSFSSCGYDSYGAHAEFDTFMRLVELPADSTWSRGEGTDPSDLQIHQTTAHESPRLSIVVVRRSMLRSFPTPRRSSGAGCSGFGVSSRDDARDIEGARSE